jgi:serine protease Do
MGLSLLARRPFTVAGLALTGFALGILARAQLAPAPPAAAEVTRTALLADDLQDLFGGVAEMVRPAVVYISSTRTIPMPQTEERLDAFLHGQRQLRQRSLGSGVVIDPRGYVLTNYHVVGDSEELLVKSGDGRSWPARVVEKEEGADIALLKVEARSLPSVPLGNSESIKVGQWVLAIGSPFGLTQTVSAGIVSAVGRSDLGILPFESFIQTDASINQGNSGGPLVDLRGHLIGINTAIFSSSCGSSLGIGFAVPVNLARALVEKWIEGKSSSYLGVKPARLDEDAARYFGLESSRGVLMEAVNPDSPAERGGIQAMDIVVRFSGVEVRDENHFRYLIARAEAGRPVVVEIVRPEKGGSPRRMCFELTLTERDLAAPSSPERGPGEPLQTRMLGITVAPLVEELARELALPDGTAGVAVIEVEPNSPAETKGVREGDVILEVNERKVTDIQELRSAIQEQAQSGGEPGRVVMLRLLRGGKDIGYKFLPR